VAEQSCSQILAELRKGRKGAKLWKNLFFSFYSSNPGQIKEIKVKGLVATLFVYFSYYYDIHTFI
jgi:hypothetical protein